eukprot:4991886-Pyramimonas_sp.AAC.1
MPPDEVSAGHQADRVVEEASPEGAHSLAARAGQCEPAPRRWEQARAQSMGCPQRASEATRSS